jgi:hypothetical protein
LLWPQPRGYLCHRGVGNLGWSARAPDSIPGLPLTFGGQIESNNTYLSTGQVGGLVVDPIVKDGGQGG